MNPDQAVLHHMVERMRASLAIETENRMRRQRRVAWALFDDERFARGAAAGRGTSDGGLHSVPHSQPFLAEATSRTGGALEPPKARAGRLAPARPVPPRRKLAGPARSQTARKLAAGYQPAVLKVISYGHGVTRAKAIGQYIQKEGVSLETHDGRLLATREAVAAEMKAWARSFDRRRPSEDVATFRLTLAGDNSAERLEAAIGAGFAGHGHAFRIDRDRDGSLSARVVATMAGHAVERGEDGEKKVKHRFHFSDIRQRERQFSAPTQALISGRIVQVLGIGAKAVGVKPVGEASHGKAGVVFQLSRLSFDGAATRDDGVKIRGKDQVRQTAQAWDKSLNSHTPRDTMHMIFSARASEDRAALTRTVRGFLHARFPDHRFAFGLHADKAEEGGHIHVHAIIAVKGQNGERLRPGPADFRAWRALYAELAQAQGMKIVAVSAAYRASSQSYGPRDKAIAAAALRPRPGREARDSAYAEANPRLIEKARHAIARAGANPVKVPLTMRQLEMAQASLKEWRDEAHVAPNNGIANQYTDRMTRAVESGRIVVALREGKGAAMSWDATAEEMRQRLKAINDTVSQTAALMGGKARAEFLRRAGETMEILATRADLKAMQERGVTHISEDEARQIAGPRAEALVQRALEIAAAERLEAEQARRLRDRAIERERRDEAGAGAADPASLEQVAQDRDAVHHARTIAMREAREAQAAAEAARSLADNPDAPLDPDPAKGERLASLRRDQAHRINTAPIEGEEAQADRHKPQSQ